jgi:leucyl aminopeptidase
MALLLRDGEDADGYVAAAVGALAGSFRPMDTYGRVRDTDAMKRTVEELVLIGTDDAAIAQAIHLAEAVEWGRQLANRSANDLFPERMADEARILEEDGCTVEVLDVDEMRALGMEALLGVGLGAAHEPRLIAIRLPGWESAPADRRLAIVGKGVCFDSGGISIKPADKMEEMKHDKSGAAAVIAAARAVARIAPETPLMAVAPMVENLPSATAQRPGDVVRAMNGKTVEVINTDAEGRLILIDALHWAEQQGATHLVDIATLTGAASVAFGDLISAYFSRPRDWGASVQAAADATGEWFWEMPLAVEYRPALDSAYADIVNSGSRDGSLIKSAVFIADFVTKPWVHVDIAGSAYNHADKAGGAKGATGAGVTTLARLAMDFGAG